jgi:hypothetical protein
MCVFEKPLFTNCYMKAKYVRKHPKMTTFYTFCTHIFALGKQGARRYLTRKKHKLCTNCARAAHERFPVRYRWFWVFLQKMCTHENTTNFSTSVFSRESEIRPYVEIRVATPFLPTPPTAAKHAFSRKIKKVIFAPPRDRS